MAEHAWVQQNLDTYLAGELTTSERDRVERHVADCQECTQALMDSRQLERVMNGLFADARPDANLEERIIHSLGTAPVPARQRPMAWRFAAGAAAVLIVGLIGAAVQGLSGDSKFHVVNLEMQDATLSMVGKKINGKPEQIVKSQSARSQPDPYANVDIDPAQKEYDTDVQYSAQRKVTLSTTEDAKENGDKTFKVRVTDGKGGAVDEIVKSTKKVHEAGYDEKKLDARTFFDQADGKNVNLDGNNKEGKAKGFYREYDKGSGDAKEGENKKDVKDLEGLEKLLRDKGDKSPEVTAKATEKPHDMDPMKVMKDKLLYPFPMPVTTKLPGYEGPAASTTTVGGGVIPGMGLPGFGGPGGLPPLPGTKDPKGTPSIISTPPAVLPANPPPGPKATVPPPGPVTPAFFPPASEVPAPSPPSDPNYYKGKNGGEKKGFPPPSPKKEAPGKLKGEDEAPDGSKPGGDQGKGNDKGQGEKGPDGSKPGEPKKQPEPKVEEPPIETGRKIIRTGEMEFETESFDKSIENITKLITGVKGGFVATINSDKLPNGKMKGSIVVRMPPQFLDKFVLDLRRELAKTSELKNQRIISLDVTKQYTDIESRLRAARTMEERLIQIIKVGKGEIKDLVMAEKELGVWRTKIEEMEGEMRYYANQVALSTLTITLSEKEILSPTAIILSETVRMRLEVDDVSKSHQIAMTAVMEVKGRITRSELKQHVAGQLSSIIHAEIPPAKKDEFRDKLKKLGIVSDHEENQTQRTEGGFGPGFDLKPKTNDVHFDITMHNTANVRPRLTADLKIATTDVPAAYGKILEEIARVKGQVRDGKLNEQDKQNITAILDFNVPTADKAAIDKVLMDVGPVLERLNVLAPVSEVSTDRKFGYHLLLRDFASIPPSRAIVENVATFDVSAAYARIQEAIATAKGTIADAKLNEQDKLNVNAQIDFTVPSEEKTTFDKLIAELGTSLSRTNVQAPLRTLSTGRKFGYTILLRDFASIPPSKAVDETIAAFDVAASYGKIVDALTKAKAQVTTVSLNEADKNNVSAEFHFSVLTQETPNIDKLLADLGTILSRSNVQVPMNQLSTPKKFGYMVHLRDFASIPPSKAVVDTIAAVDVPAAYGKLTEALVKAKAQIALANLNELDKHNVNAQLDFTILVEEKLAIDKVLADIGTSLQRTNMQVAMNQLSTPKKFGYMLLLRDFATVPPSKSTEMTVAASDVPAAYAKVLDAVANGKGLMVDSKLNERDKQNISAQLAFSIPSEGKKNMDELLELTGAVVSRNNTQAQPNTLSTTKKFGYFVTLRDFKSIPPSKAAELKLAVTDVIATFAELQEAIGKAKGHIIDAKLNEQDKHNINAQLVFDLPTEEQPGFDKLLEKLEKLGTRLSRKNVTAPVTEPSLDRKFGYSLDLRDFAYIKPSKASEVAIAASNVPDKYASLLKAIARVKGQIYDAELNKKDMLNISGTVKFNVPIDEKPTIDTLLADMGSILSSNNTQAPMSEPTTERKFGYSVTISDFANIKPRETFIVSLVMNDVPASFRELQEVVNRAKGWVNVAQLKDDNKNKIEADFDFDVPKEEKAAIEEAVKKSGAVLSRTSSQIPVNERATDHKVGFKINLRSTASLSPREIVFVTFEVAKVDERATELKEIVLAAKGRIADSNIERQANGQVTATLVFEVPYGSQDSLVRQMKRDDIKLVSQKSERKQVPENELTTARIVVTLNGVQPIIGSEEGVGAYVRTSLATSFKILAYIVMTLIIGLSAIVPLVLLVWVGFKVYGIVASAAPARPIMPTMAASGSKLMPEEDKPAEGDTPAKS